MDEEFLRALLEKLRILRLWIVGKSARFYLLLLLAIALAYYGSYFRHDLRFRDEGGTVALNAQRLLAGELPFQDVTLNYNVLWYYPIVALFKFTGVNFVLMRVYFLALSTLAAVLGFYAVLRAGRQPWLAFFTGLICVLVPGMIFKNYIPLLVVANSLLLLVTALRPAGGLRGYLVIAAGGCLLGVTYLIRIDLGLFFTVLWCGLHLLRLLDPSVPWRRRLLTGGAGVILTLTLAFLMHVPVLRDAQRRGFADAFLQDYQAFPQMIERQIRSRLGLQGTAPRREGRNTATAPIFWQKEELRRSAWQDLMHGANFETRAHVLLTYLPLAVLLSALAWTLAALVRSLRAADAGAYRRALAALVVLGGALTAFPQFFFFRPDPPHLSEFSPGYWVALASAIMLLSDSPGRRSRLLRHILLSALLGHAVLYLAGMLPNRWTGTIAARFGRDQRFVARNGVDVYVSPLDRPALESLLKTVQDYSAPGEYLVAYPYHPTINVMTDRPTYEKNVYVDNATRSRRWDQEAIARFEKYRPAIIVFSDWDVNGHDESRFSRWAAPTLAWIKANYQFRGTFKTEVDQFEVFSRK